MDQFYFQYEWTPALRRRTRTEIEITHFKDQLEIVDTEIKLDALCMVVVTVATVHAFLILDRIEALEFSLIYDAIYLALLTGAACQACIRLLGPSRESLKKLKDSKIRSRWITIGIVVGLIPVLIAGVFVGIHLPTMVLYPAALIVHELIILGSLFFRRHQINNQIRGMQQYIQQELNIRELPAPRDLRAI